MVQLPVPLSLKQAAVWVRPKVLRAVKAEAGPVVVAVKAAELTGIWVKPPR